MKQNRFSTQNFLFVILSLAVGLIAGSITNRAEPIAAEASMIEATLIPRFISLPVETAVAHSDAFYEINGGGDLSGMAFPNTGFPRFSTGFSLPPDYASGTNIVVRITWGNSSFNATSCGVRLRSNGIIGYRPNTHQIASEGEFVGSDYYDGSEITLTTPSTGAQIRQTEMIISGVDHLDNPRYEPGDSMSLTIARDTADSKDTCTGKLYILGMNATYQGLSTYLPLVTN